MSLRTRFRRPLLWSAAALLAALLAVPAAAQPPSPLELARGLRENGYTELALEYLKELETAPLSPDDKAALGLEKAKALLDASEEEPDEGTRVGMVAVAKEGLNAFLLAAPNHPRKVEGLLATAKLIALDAREQLNRARRIDIPPAGEDEVARDAAQEKQKAEARKARPLFLLASKRYAEASELLRAKVGEVTDVNAKKALERDVLDADLAAGINQFNTAETFMPVTRQTIAEQEERNKYLEASKDIFGKLDKGGAANRTVWVARAWIAEVTYEQNDFNTAAQQVAAILKANLLEAEDGKRLAKFFQLRRDFLAALGSDVKKLSESERALFAWLQQYGNPRRPTPEVYAVRYYRARALHVLAESSIPRPKEPNPKDPPPKQPVTPPPPVTFGATARQQFTEAERLYRGLAQTDHDYTGRAAKYRMQVVRRLLGDADQPLSTYDTFEKAQMASLIQLGKLSAEEQKKDADPEKVQAVRMSAVLLLERARELYTPADNPADVADVLIRLIYFYQLSGQPYKAAVLGEHVSRTMPKLSGGKAAVAGLLGLNGYTLAAARLKIDPAATAEEMQAQAEAKKADRARAMTLARFLDEKYPNDNATDSARFRLASMLTEDKRMPEAFDVILKVRPAYPLINEVRLLEGYLASQLILKDSGLEPAKKIEVFNRAKVDLAKAAKPPTVALENDVRAYISARCRLATLMLSQGRVDAKAEAASPGYDQAMTIADEVLADIPKFDCLQTDKKPNLDGMELSLIAQDVRARALYLRSRALIEAGKVEEAGKALEPALAEIDRVGPSITPEMKAWGSDGMVEDAAQRDKILKLAAGVDKTRIEVLLAGFRLRISQGNARGSEIMLALIERVGGTIEDNLPVLEALGRETAGKMIAYRKEGKTKEATELGIGLAFLLNRIRSVPNLSAQQLVFIGQMLTAVGEYESAIAALKNIKEPEFKEWKTTSPDKMRTRAGELKKQMEEIENMVIKTLPAEDQARAADQAERPEVVKKVVSMLQEPHKGAYNTAKTERTGLEKKLEELPKGLEQRFNSQMGFYSTAQLGIARALREDKRFQASEAMLNEIIGTLDKPGWGSTRLYFRKELATLHEERAATVTNDLKVAGQEWGRALQIWTTLNGIATSRLQNFQKQPVPKLPDNATAEQKAEYDGKVIARRVEEVRLKNEYADAYFERVRCTVKANLQLRAAPNLKDKLQKSQEDSAKSVIDMEKQLPKVEDWDAEVQHRYVTLLAETPAMLAEYKKLGGKVFLEKKPAEQQ